MKVNLKKTEIIVFRNCGPLIQYEQWYYEGALLKTTAMYKYLGILFTPKLSWSMAKSKLAAQANKSIFAIKRFQVPFGRFLHNDMFKLFDAMVVPILTFGAEIWGNSYASEIESIQAQFCKDFLGVNSSVNDVIALGECGRLPLCIIYYTKCIKYWCKLLQMPDYRYPKNCYKMLLAQDNAGRTNWVSNVKSMLFRYGFGFVWVAQGVGNVNNFAHCFKNRLIECSSQNWHSSINESPRCGLYKHIKSQLEHEMYLTLDMTLKFRHNLARFRCSSHKLEIYNRST